MPDRNDGPAEDEPDGDSQDDDQARETMADVDHTHPDTDESFTETGVYARGKKQPDEADDG